MISTWFVARTHGDQKSSSLRAQERKRLASWHYIWWLLHLCHDSCTCVLCICCVCLLRLLARTHGDQKISSLCAQELVCAGACVRRSARGSHIDIISVTWLLHLCHDSCTCVFCIFWVCFLCLLARTHGDQKNSSLRPQERERLASWHYIGDSTQSSESRLIHVCLLCLLRLFSVSFTKNTRRPKERELACARACTSVQRGRGFGCGTLMVEYLCHDPFICVMTHSSVGYLCHDLLICGISISWRIHLQHAWEELWCGYD